MDQNNITWIVELGVATGYDDTGEWALWTYKVEAPKNAKSTLLEQIAKEMFWAEWRKSVGAREGLEVFNIWLHSYEKE